MRIMKIVSFGTLLLTIPVIVYGDPAASVCPGFNGPLNPVASSHQDLSVSTTAVKLTVPAKALLAVVVVDALGGINHTDDGTTPTSTVGTPRGALVEFVVCQNSLGVIQFIRQNVDTKIHVDYYGR